MVVLTDNRCDNISAEFVSQYLSKVAVIVHYSVSKCQNNTGHSLYDMVSEYLIKTSHSIARAERDGTRAETRFRLSPETDESI